MSTNSVVSGSEPEDELQQPQAAGRAADSQSSQDPKGSKDPAAQATANAGSQPSGPAKTAEHAEEVEEYDYTAQSLLQAPLSKKALFSRKPSTEFAEQPRQLASAHQPGSNSKTQELSKLKQANKRSVFLLKGLAIAFLCFIFSYGIASLIYLQNLHAAAGNPLGDMDFSQILASLLRYSQENMLLVLFFIAAVTSIITAVLSVLLIVIKKLRNRMRHYNKSHSSALSSASAPILTSATHNKLAAAQRVSPSPQTIQAQNNHSSNKTAGPGASKPALAATAVVETQKLPPEQELTQSPAEADSAGQGQSALQTGSGAQLRPVEDLAQSGLEAESDTKNYDSELQNGQFYTCLKFLLRKKLRHYLQILCYVGASLACSLLTLSYLGLLISPGITLFVLLFLALGVLAWLILHNQYVQGAETLYQSLLQQFYQYSSPTNSYNQLHAVNMLYALAFVEPRQFLSRIIAEFQNILKLTRSSWYQTKYNNSPSILVEEALRKLLSAVDFHQLLFASPLSQAPSQMPSQKVRKKNRFLRECLYYLLFFKNFQNFRMFRDHATLSLLSCMSDYADNHKASRRAGNQQDRLSPHFVLENYYLVGVNLSNLRIKEAHFQNCQLSHSDWANSDLSDCSISSSRLDQIILYRSSWRRFLWQANTAREINIEHGFFLQGNIQYCNLQGLQSQSASAWRMQHCLLQECNLSHSTFCLDAWQNVRASDCDLGTALFLLHDEVYRTESENLAQTLGNHLQIKGL